MGKLNTQSKNELAAAGYIILICIGFAIPPLGVLMLTVWAVDQLKSAKVGE